MYQLLRTACNISLFHTHCYSACRGSGSSNGNGYGYGYGDDNGGNK